MARQTTTSRTIDPAPAKVAETRSEPLAEAQPERPVPEIKVPAQTLHAMKPKHVMTTMLAANFLASAEAAAVSRGGHAMMSHGEAFDKAERLIEAAEKRFGSSLA